MTSYYDLNPKEVEKLWRNASCKKDFMEAIGILNKDYRALKRALKFYNLKEEDMGINLQSNYHTRKLINDKTGKFFGDLEVISLDEKISALRKRPYYKCFCHKCNNIHTFRADRLIEEKIYDCGCDNLFQKRINAVKDLSNQQFNDLLVIDINIDETRKHKQGIYWNCICQRCGNNTVVLGENLKSGNTQSCGCKHKDVMKQKRRDISHQHFGFLEPLEIDEKYTENFKKQHPYFTGAYWICYCHNCNKIVDKPIRGNDLIQKKRISCGCLKESYGEIKIKEILNTRNINFIPQYRTTDLKGINNGYLSFDFAIINQNQQPICFIEFNGKQHYGPVAIFGGEEAFRTQQANDKIKEKYCIEKNITLLSIPYYEIDNIETLIINTLKSIC